MYTDSDDLLSRLMGSAVAGGEPLWRMPLAAEYEVKFLETSAKHDINVWETFTAIAREVVARIPAEGAASTRGATRLSGTSGKKKSSCCG